MNHSQEVHMSGQQSSRSSMTAQGTAGAKDSNRDRPLTPPWLGSRGSTPSSPYLQPPPSRGSRQGPGSRPINESAYQRPPSVERPTTRQGSAADGARKGRLGRLMHTYGLTSGSPARTVSPGGHAHGRDGTNHLGLSPRSPWASAYQRTAGYDHEAAQHRRGASREEAHRGAVTGGSRGSPGAHMTRKEVARGSGWAGDADLYRSMGSRGRHSRGKPLLPGAGTASDGPWAGGAAGRGWQHPAHSESDEHQLVLEEDSDSDAHSCSSGSHGEVCHIPVIVTHGHMVVGTLGGPFPGGQDDHFDHQVDGKGGWDVGQVKHESMDGSSIDGAANSTSIARRTSVVVAERSSDVMASYEEIPVYEQGMDYAAASHLPGGAAQYESSEDNVYGGMTLDVFMSQMQTTPASLAATSGLGQPAGEADDVYEEVPEHLEMVPQSFQGNGLAASPFKQQVAPLQLAGLGSGGLQGAHLTSPASPHSRHAMAALNNSFDLRPATACAPCLGNSSDFDDASISGRFSHIGSHTVAPIKQVDLAGLSASLFTPNSHSTSGSISGAQKSGNWAAVPESSLRHSHVDALWGGQRPESARRNSGSSYGAGSLSPRVSGSLGCAALPSKSLQSRNSVNSILEARGALDSYSEPRHALATVSKGPVEVAEQHADLEVVAAMAAAPAGVVRQVQSARPQGARADIPIDPTVWRDYISVQLERPPSRQRPPPEALHLWNPLPAGRGASQGLTDNPAGPTLRMRPQSAAPSTGQALRSSWGSAATGGAWAQLGDMPRPPTRQKPPPMSVLMEHGEEFNIQPGAGHNMAPWASNHSTKTAW